MAQILEDIAESGQSEPSERRWTRQEYYRLADGGFFDDQRVELIEGRIIRMPAQGLGHTQAVELVENFARIAFTSGYRFRVQMPFRAADGSDPEPDLAIVAGSPRDPTHGHPTMAVLIVEVADTTLRHDRRKAKLYAASGVQDYWILNLVDGAIEVHRDPLPLSSETIPAYANVKTLTREQTLAPLAAPLALTKVADLLP